LYKYHGSLRVCERKEIKERKKEKKKEKKRKKEGKKDRFPKI